MDAKQTFIIEVSYKGQTKKFESSQANLVVGRASTCRVWLPKVDVISREHVRIEARADGVYFTDLNSSNGTYFAGTRLSPNVPTRYEGQSISLGAKEFECFVTVTVNGSELGKSAPRMGTQTSLRRDAIPPEMKHKTSSEHTRAQAGDSTRVSSARPSVDAMRNALDAAKSAATAAKASVDAVKSNTGEVKVANPFASSSPSIPSPVSVAHTASTMPPIAATPTQLVEKPLEEVKYVPGKNPDATSIDAIKSLDANLKRLLEAEEELGTLMSKKSQLQSDIDHLTKDREEQLAMEVVYQKHFNELPTLRTEVENSRNEVKIRKEQLDRLQERYEALEPQIDARTTLLEAKDAELDTTTAELQEKVGILAVRKDELSKANETLKATLEQAKETDDRWQDLEQKINEGLSQFEELQTDQQKLNEEVDGINQRLLDLRTVKADAEEKTKAVELLLDKAESDLKGIQRRSTIELGTLEAELKLKKATYERECEEVLAKKAQISHEIEDSHREVARIKKTIAELDAERILHHKAADQEETRLKSLQSDISSHIEQKERLAADIVRIQGEFDSLDEKVNAIITKANIEADTAKANAEKEAGQRIKAADEAIETRNVAADSFYQTRKREADEEHAARVSTYEEEFDKRREESEQFYESRKSEADAAHEKRIAEDQLQWQAAKEIADTEYLDRKAKADAEYLERKTKSDEEWLERKNKADSDYETTKTAFESSHAARTSEAEAEYLARKTKADAEYEATKSEFETMHAARTAAAESEYQERKSVTDAEYLQRKNSAEAEYSKRKNEADAEHEAIRSKFETEFNQRSTSLETEFASRKSELEAAQHAMIVGFEERHAELEKTQAGHEKYLTDKRVAMDLEYMNYEKEIGDKRSVLTTEYEEAYARAKQEFDSTLESYKLEAFQQRKKHTEELRIWLTDEESRVKKMAAKNVEGFAHTVTMRSLSEFNPDEKVSISSLLSVLERKIIESLTGQVQGEGLYNPDLKKSVRGFWVQASAAAVGIVILAAGLKFGPDIMSQKLEVMKVERKQEDAAFMREVEAQRQRMLALHLDVRPQFQDNYVDNVLYNPGYLAMKLDPEIQKKWTVALSKFFFEELLFDDRKVVDFVPIENSLMTGLNDTFKVLNSRNFDVNLPLMRKVEQQKEEEMWLLVGGRDNWLKLRKREADFYSQFKVTTANPRTPAGN